MRKQSAKLGLLVCFFALVIASFAMTQVSVRAQGTVTNDNLTPSAQPTTATGTSISPTLSITATLSVTATVATSTTVPTTSTATAPITATATVTPPTPTKIPPTPTVAAPIQPTTAPPTLAPTQAPPTSVPPTSTPTLVPTAMLTPIQGIVKTVQDNAIIFAIVAAGLLALALILGIIGARLLRGGEGETPPVSEGPFLESVVARDVQFTLAKPVVTIGRAKDCDIQIPEKLPGSETVSLYHARIENREGRWVLVDGVKPDKPSANGVFVNGSRTRENYLNENVKVGLGRVVLRFRAQAAPPDLPEEIGGTVCPNCQHVNRAGAKHCSRCGAALNQTTDAPPPPESIAAKASNVPYHKRETDELATRGFAALPDGAIVNGKYEVRQGFPGQPEINSYLVADKQDNLYILFESQDPNQFASERTLFDRKLHHAALVALDNVFQETQYDAQPRGYMVTEYPVTPVANLGLPAEIDLLNWGKQLAEGLGYLHDAGFAHANIHAANLVVAGDKKIKLWNPALTPITSELRDQDIYQLAYVLWQIGTPQGQQAPPVSPATLQIFQRALAPEPRSRYPDARAFANDVSQAIEALRRPVGINVVVGRVTDVGMKRELNEDALIVIDVAQFIQGGGQTLGLYAVADGMGGAAAGEVASRMVTQTLARQVIAQLLAPRFNAPPATPPDYGALIKSAAEQANAEIFAARKTAHTDMGSTLVGALVVGNQVYIVNVGDSRAYWIAGEQIEKISKDHSLVQAFVDRGEIGEDDVYTHPQRNFILRNVGDKDQVQVDLFTRAVEPGQHILLCSDGLWEMVYPKNRLREIITQAASPQDACRQLVEAANAHGGDDNITCIVIKFERA